MINQESPDHQPDKSISETTSDQPIASTITSIKDLIKVVSGKDLDDENQTPDFGFSEKLPYPFSAIVGQREMKLALLLSLINPQIGGVLIMGPRGTGKTTAVRSLMPLLPMVERSACFYGCSEDDLQSGGNDAICEACLQKVAHHLPLTQLEPSRLIELPLNAEIDDVIGQMDDSSSSIHAMRLKKGILSKADRNLLLVDEINLLQNHILDAILDASAYGSYTIRRGQLSATLKSRFSMIATMNPQEGTLRPQILDRFGLRVFADSLTSIDERYLAYQRSQLFRAYPYGLIKEFEEETRRLSQDIVQAQQLVSQMNIPDEIARMGIALITQLKIPSIRAEISLLEAAKAHAAADNRSLVTYDDLQAVAGIALRLRTSSAAMLDENERNQEDQRIQTTLQDILHNRLSL